MHSIKWKALWLQTFEVRSKKDNCSHRYRRRKKRSSSPKHGNIAKIKISFREAYHCVYTFSHSIYPQGQLRVARILGSVALPIPSLGSLVRPGVHTQIKKGGSISLMMRYTLLPRWINQDIQVTYCMYKYCTYVVKLRFWGNLSTIKNLPKVPFSRN